MFEHPEDMPEPSDNIEYWTTAEDKTYRLETLETQHLKSIVRFLVRKGRKDDPRVDYILRELSVRAITKPGNGV